MFMQRVEGLTLRQTMTLANRAWMDLPTAVRVLPLFWTDNWKRQGSYFLRLALLVTFLGLTISPLQAIFCSSTTIKASTSDHSITGLVDFVDSWNFSAYNSYPDESNRIMVMTRAALTTATTEERHVQLWSCNPLEHPVTDSPCMQGGARFDNISALSSPFLAELPVGFNTALIRQYLPRINSSAKYEEITEDEFPTGCADLPDALFADYANTTDIDGYGPSVWGLRACMPANVTHSPWKATRDRQDFSEVLFLNVSLNYYMNLRDEYHFYKLTLNTTAGYFELPNYMNLGVPGPLLESDLGDLCGDDCKYQGFGSRTHNRRNAIATRPAAELEVVADKGPLFKIAMALFGQGSFIASRAQHPEAYAGTATPNWDETPPWPINSGACIDLAPVGRLLKDVQAVWVYSFMDDTERLENAFTSAAFLANKARLEHDFGGWSGLDVSYDMGADTQVPAISTAGVVVVSALLGLRVAALLGLGVYAAWSPRWTKTLDSIAMLRM
ncbi:hypothetical protein BDV12DRAFT_197342 [Aspergillus spectabilis]